MDIPYIYTREKNCVEPPSSIKWWELHELTYIFFSFYSTLKDIFELRLKKKNSPNNLRNISQFYM
jgi:hypothetical protein